MGNIINLSDFISVSVLSKERVNELLQEIAEQTKLLTQMVDDAYFEDELEKLMDAVAIYYFYTGYGLGIRVGEKNEK